MCVKHAENFKLQCLLVIYSRRQYNVSVPLKKNVVLRRINV